MKPRRGGTNTQNAVPTHQRDVYLHKYGPYYCVFVFVNFSFVVILCACLVAFCFILGFSLKSSHRTKGHSTPVT